MITHVVCFRFRDGIDWDDPRASAAERITRGHPEHVPQILSWTVGRNVTDRPTGYDFAVVATFADLAALEAYQQHPDHRRGVRAWRELSTWVVVDLDASPVAG